MTWLVTGGAGYIGSHVVNSLIQAEIPVAVLDDFSSGLHSRCPEGIKVFDSDICNMTEIQLIFDSIDITGVIHCAAKKSVEESIKYPEIYEKVNVIGTANLLDASYKSGIRNFVYSSSAAVYGNQEQKMVSEEVVCKPVSPYGKTKLAAENLVTKAGVEGLNVCSLRYFNVAGAVNKKLADTSINNLFPIVLNQLLNGEQPHIFGTDYETPDGTCIRDYVHIVDLAEVHKEIALKLPHSKAPSVINVGTGLGISVKEVIDTITKALNSNIEPIVDNRRPGDIGQLVADVQLLKRTLGRVPTKGLNEIIASLLATI